MAAKKKQLLYEQIVEQLQSQIMAGFYKKGDKLPTENELMEASGVSRITVRKALAILTERGLIRTSKGHGSEVIFSLEDIHPEHELAKAAAEYKELFDASTQIRIMLEPEIARRVAEVASEEEIAYLSSILDDPVVQANELDVFHQAIADILHNKLLSEQLSQLLMLEANKGPLEDTIPENQEIIHKDLIGQHKRILKAIKNHDGEFAYFYMKEHLIYISNLYKAYFESNIL